jgi:hypothetical protein
MQSSSRIIHRYWIIKSKPTKAKVPQYMLSMTMRQKRDRIMKKNNLASRSRRMRSSNQRRILLKKLHQRVLNRRKQFATSEMNEEYQQAC